MPLAYPNLRPRISILISLTGHSQIVQIVGALARQTVDLANDEVLVVDATGDPATQQELAGVDPEFARQINLRRFCISQGGRAWACNEALRRARGELYLFLGSDFIPQSDWVEQHLLLHQEYSEKHVVGLGPSHHADHLMTQPFVRWLATRSTEFESVDYGPETEQSMSRFFHSNNTSIKRSLIWEAGLFDIDLLNDAIEDHELGVRLARLGMEATFLPAACVIRDHAATFNEWRGQMFRIPDYRFPPPHELRAEYERRVQLGQRRMSSTTAVISGLARNVAGILPLTIARIEQMGAMFADYRVVIYENDSSDETARLLTDWAERNHRIDVTIERRGDPINPMTRCLKRAERMAYYRNQCLETIRTRYPDFDHAIIVDTDLAGGWSCDGLANTFGQDDWDFVGSNGVIFKRVGLKTNVLMQYDAWAFRSDEAFTPFTTKQVNNMSFTRGEPLVPVTCSFGGLGVYLMPAYLAGQYAGHDVDHVTHQQVARPQGFTRTFLNPSQIAMYGRHRRSWDPVIFPTLKLCRQLPGLRHWLRDLQPFECSTECPPIRVAG